MFKLLNVYNKSNLIMAIEHNGKDVEFNLSSLLNKRNKVELDPENQFTLLEEYIDYKGPEFKNKLMIAYLNADDRLMGTITMPEVYPLPVSIVYEILDMFDYNDILNWVINIRKVPTLPNLADKFDSDDANDSEFTRAQTYLKSEYLELVALTIIIKSVIGPIAHYGYLKNSEINGAHKEYILYNFIDGHPVSKLPPTLRLKAFTEKLVSIALKESTVTAVRIIEKRIPKEETADYILAAIMLQKVSIASIVNDTSSKNIITMIYTFINNKLSVKGDTSNSIRAKDGYMDAEIGEKESIVESYRMTVSVAPNIPIELNWSLEDTDDIFKLLNLNPDKEIFEDATEFCKIFLDRSISIEQEILLTYIFKDVITPLGIKYLNIESIYNLMRVGFTWLWMNNHNYLALLLGSVVNTNTDDGVLQVNITVNRSRLPIELKEELQYWFPYERVINKTTTANEAEEAITKLTNEMYGQDWHYICGDKYVNVVDGSRSGLPADLKTLITKMVIYIEKRRKV